jgi:hypothetical protein
MKDTPRDPAALERSIVDRIARRADERTRGIEQDKERSRLHDHWIQRLRRELAYRRFLARIFTAQPNQWVLKGGVALQFRLDPNRPSNDIDIAHLAHGADHAVAVRQLRIAAMSNLADGFVFTIGEPGPAQDEDRAITVLVTARIGSKEFTSFRVDMPPPRDDIPNDTIVTSVDALGIAALDEMPPLRLIALEQQVADKVCAMFELHGAAKRPSERSRDLGDLAMLAAQCSFDGDLLHASIRAEEKRRQDGLLANGLPDRIELAREQLAQWPRTWRTQARDPQFSFDESLAITQRFLNPVLAGAAAGQRWDLEQGWHDV